MSNRDSSDIKFCGCDINLIVQYYKCFDEKRQSEIDCCLSNNLKNSFLTAIHVLTESFFDFSSFPNREKIIQTVIGERMTFQKAFQYANTFNGDAYWLLSNADIFFDESLRYLCHVDMRNRFYALTRYEVLQDSSIQLVDVDFAHGCQDTWIFKNPVPLERMFTNFFLGAPGCDHRIAYEFAKAGFLVSNPSKRIIARHIDRLRVVDLVTRTLEYESLQCDESYKNGKVVPPPYLRHLYPTENLDKEYFEVVLLLNQKVEEYYQYKQHMDQALREIHCTTREKANDSSTMGFKNGNKFFDIIENNMSNVFNRFRRFVAGIKR